MPIERTRADLLAACESQLLECQKDLGKFQERFANNPAHAFRWAPLQAAAYLNPLQSVADACKGDLLDGETEEQAFARLCDYIEYQAMSHADRMNLSTSACSNLLADNERVIWVRLMKFVSGKATGWL